jgi:hypothetical protein
MDNGISPEDLEKIIEEKERKRDQAVRERDVWNSGKNKHTDRAVLSRSLVESYDKELAKLYQQLSELKRQIG